MGAAAAATDEHSRQAATAPEALANEAVKENKGEEEQGEGSRQELPTWLPLRSLDSKERLKTKQGRAALLAREVEELEVEVAQQRAELSRRGITPPASREA
ncbi:hypothetical protein PTSG_01134 [Salpingoeca rosetta]|uniref:Uncharacterized protein n=1 Tax=Salpingoeca rosetta (strain ATCC 50818 / BSB-021) TaxID=946362 RepID=F2U0W9_SALR5|nr:uncharacterized protein PTSG_01134 [Salpingoeca rosetta]EGD80543.1 hypothetical protein PTSG_01134 [Salpingoeca rosetta]|eukprot:XP_004997104.1 hypothetical protein PTSG_01134 [Salpingoeca rosetta]